MQIKTEVLILQVLSVGLAKRLSVPDDYFTLSQAVSFQHYILKIIILDYLLLVMGIPITYLIQLD